MSGDHVTPELAAAEAVQAGPFTVAAVAAALQQLRRRESASQLLAAQQVVTHFGSGRRLMRDELARFFAGNRAFRRAFARGECWPEVLPPRMHAALGPATGWSVPAIVTAGQLADWLAIDADQLQGLTRSFRGDQGRRDRRLPHYHRHWQPRRHAPPRLLEAPKQRLKAVQRRILSGILNHVPAHQAAHGFVQGRSVQTYVSAHTGKRCVMRMDLEDCFASFGRGRVVRVFLNLGYPEHVAVLLARLCTVPSPLPTLQAELTDRRDPRTARLYDKLRRPHLPQGAPSSPALANLCAVALDGRLLGLARRFGADYSRYADDLLFSGGEEFRRTAHRCAIHAAAILLEERLDVAHRKTRVMAASQAQRAGGLVLNAGAALPRRERERLEAILYNCVHKGPASQNRSGVVDFEAHLRGRVAYAGAFDPSGRFARLFAAIDWTR